MQFTRKILVSFLLLFAVLAGFSFLKVFLAPEVRAQNSSVGGSILNVGLDAGQMNLFAGSDSGELILAFASRNYGVAGTSVTLSGSGFSTKSNAIYFKGAKKGAKKNGDVTIENVVAKNSGELTFVIPNTIRPGRYDISVSNAGGASGASRKIKGRAVQKTSDTVPFMVTVPGSSAPIIEKIEPVVAKFGGPIKITGRNFTPTGNIISSSLGIVGDLKSADGRTITLTIPLPEFFENDQPRLRKIWFGEKDNLYWPIHARIANVNGISESAESAKFTINL